MAQCPTSTDLFQAYVGTGQMVSPTETDRIFSADTLAWARETGRDDLVATLLEIGSPPYDSILDNEPALKWEPEVYPLDHSVNSEGMVESVLPIEDGS